VDDLIPGLISLMDSSDEITGPVNLGNPHEFTIAELAEKVLELTESKSPVIYKELPSDDPQQRKPNISKAKKLLNWEPTIHLDEGLIPTLDYFMQELRETD
jgi:UDP-glucuronate decarboxylase